MKTNSDLERWTAAQIAKADSFSACMFLGHGRFDRRAAATLQEARLIRRRMITEYADRNYGRGVMIYALVNGGTLSIHVE